MHLVLKVMAFLIWVNPGVVFGQTQAPPAKPSLPSYLLEPVETSAATYPAVAREKKLQGETLARFVVSETGAVENIQVIKGDSLLASAAVEALHKWKFKPVIVDGVATAVSTLATFDFVLDNDNPKPSGVLPIIAPAVKFPKRVRVSTGVAAGLLVSKVAPVYPDGARVAHIQGSVIVHAIVSKDGTVGDLQLVSGPPELAASAIDAVKQWRFRPYLLNGRPVEVETQFQVNFVLSAH